MHIENQYIFNSIMINSYRPGVRITEHNKVEADKYHYTSPEAFVNIIKDKSLFFTDIRFLNDKKEDVYLTELIWNYVKENPEKFPIITKHIDYLLGKAEDYTLEISDIKIEKTRKFVFCTSSDCDSLSMWNYYVNNGLYQGYNIGFSVEKLLKTFDTPNPNTADPFAVLYGSIIYTKEEQTKEIEALLKNIELTYKFKNDLAFAKAELCTYIDRYSPFFKHAKFKHEKEYRIVVEVSEERLKRNIFEKCFGENNKKIQYDFRTKKGLVVPQLKVEYHIDAVSRITVSPITEFNLAQESVKELLEKLNYKKVPVFKSDIPIRF